MNILLLLTIISLLILVWAVCNLFFGSSAKNSTDYFLADRNLGLFPVTFTLIATQLGGGMLLGAAQESYQVGLFGISYTLSIIIGFLLLAAGIASRLQSLNIATTAELFETVYQSPRLKKVASALSIATLSGILISQILGSRALLCGIGVDYAPFFIFFWLCIITYTMVGGLKTVAWFDSMQVIYIFLIFSAIFIWTVIKEPITLSYAAFAQIQSQFTHLSFSYTYLPTLAMPALFALIEQDLAQRFFAARTKKIAVTAAFCAGILLLLFACIPVYFGMKARLLNLSFADNASPLLPVIAHLTNEGVTACAVVGILAAITSTADALLCAISSNLVQDFNLAGTSAHGLWISKAITLLVGVICLTASYYVPSSIIGLIISSYALSVVCLFVPLLAAYYYKRLPQLAACLSIACGFSAFVICKLFVADVPAELCALACSLIGFGVGMYGRRSN